MAFLWLFKKALHIFSHHILTTPYISSRGHGRGLFFISQTSGFIVNDSCSLIRNCPLSALSYDHLWNSICLMCYEPFFHLEQAPQLYKSAAYGVAYCNGTCYLVQVSSFLDSKFHVIFGKEYNKEPRQ